MPTKAMVNLYDMSQEGDGGEFNNFTSVYDIEENKKRVTINEDSQTQNDKYRIEGGDAEEFSLAAGIKSVARSNKKQAENLTKAGKSGKKGSGKKDMVMAMAGQMQAKKSMPSNGQGIGRKAFSSMAGYSENKSSSTKGGRLSFKNMADSAKKATTLNVAVEAFKDAGRETEAKRQERFTRKFAAKGKLDKRTSTLSMSGIDLGAGVESGLGPDTGGDLFANLPE